MAKRKAEHEFLSPPGEFQIKMTKNSTSMQESPGETSSYEYLEPTNPEQDLSKNLLEELSPLLRLNDRQRLPRRRKPTKLKKLDEQVLNNKVILVRPKSAHDDSLSSKSACESLGISVSTPVFIKTPVRSTGKGIDDLNKLPKIKLNLSDGNLVKTSPKMTIKMQAADPKLLNDFQFKEKVRKFCEESGKGKVVDNSNNSMDNSNQLETFGGKSEASNSRVNYFNASKSGEEGINFKSKKKSVYYNCNNNNNYNSNNNKKTFEISENLVSTTTESTRSRRSQFSSVSIMADIFWGMMDKMKERSKDIELQSRISAAEAFKDVQQPSAKELMLRLSEKDKQIAQLEEINRDLTEKFRKEKLTGNQLRINLMRYQKQVIDLKSEVTLKTELMNEIYEASVKLRAYFEDGELCEDDDDLGMT
ncbi:uncharacterized protein LOC141531736 isoform X1 [Cotesia typhae]|uniref:uncharacterized protein LOC141531736 isoform X1 n=1 Tax=Cotesia typhae TaxID=2053667 RepID=UPI003D694917